MGISVNTSQATIVSGIDSNKDSKSIKPSSYQIGDVIQGVVTKVSDQISLAFSDKTTDVPRYSLPDIKEGDKLKFQVMGFAADGSMSLRYIPEDSKDGISKPATFTAVMNDLKGQSVSDHEVKEKEEDIARNEEDLKEIEEKMTQEDYDELVNEGFSLKKLEIERFERALKRIKMIRAQLKVSIESKVDAIKQKEREVMKASLSQISDPVMREQIAHMLSIMNLPVSKQNIDAVCNATVLASKIVTLSDDSITYLIKNDMEISPINIYTASFNGKPMNNAENDEASWKDLEGQVDQIIKGMKESGIDVSKEDAKWLYDHDLAINKDTVTAYQDLMYLKEEASITSLASSIIKGIASGKQALNVDLITTNASYVEQARKEFADISLEAIKSVIENGHKLNLSNLSKAMREAHKVDTQIGSGQGELQKELSLITARRQLEEIRVKLTYEAGIKLAAKGVDLRMDGLDRIVNELREQEAQYYQKLLSEGGANVNDHSIGLLQKTLDTREFLAQSPSYVLGSRFEHRAETSLDDLVSQASRLTDLLVKANEAYEPLMTAPRSDMGDSIKKAFANMDSLLKELQVEPTMANQRAVRILAYNQMEINQSSIDQMKEYDLLVREMINDLKPNVAVQLIKDGVNPLDTPIAMLNQYIKEIRLLHGESAEEKYSTYLAKLQKNHQLSEQERDSYIGIYRLLNNIEKTDGKAIGYLVNSGREITLNNLLKAVRTVRGKGIDTNIDDTVGLLKEVTYSSKTISEQMGAAFLGESSRLNSKISYEQQLNDKLLNHLTPEFLDYANSKCDLMNSSMEELIQLQQEYEMAYPGQDASGYESVMNQIHEAMSMTNEMKFLKDHKVPLSLENIKSASEILSHSGEFYQSLSKVIKMDEETHSKLDQLIEANHLNEFKKNYEKVINSISKQLTDAFEQPTLKVEDMMAQNEQLKNTELLKSLGKEQYYHIPMNVSGQTIDVGISIQTQTEERGKLTVRFRSETFGKVDARFRIIDHELKGLVVCENRTSSSIMERALDTVREELPENVERATIHVCIDEQSVENYHMGTSTESQNEVLCEDLYQIARSFITSVKSYDYEG